MEFLTLQDVPRYHRSAMPIGERSPTRHQVKQHETAERMKIHSQTNNNAQLPSFKELLDSTNGSPGNPSNQLKSAPTTMDYYQPPSARASRQSSAEGPVFNDPFRGAPPPNLPLRNMRPATENYTTQLEGRPSLLQARPSTNYDSRRTSVRTEYEPRIPSEPRIHSLPSIFTSRNSPPEPAPITTATQVYHPQNPYVQPIPDIRRTSEVPYGHQAYYNEHYTSRPPFASEYTRPSVRHDSTVFGMPPPAPYTYPTAYGYAADHQNGLEGFPSNRRRRGNLPKEATATLKKWFAEHAESPYPTDEEKNALAVSTGLSSAQISNWFINARRRNPGKEAREHARQVNNKLSGQQQVQRTNGTQEQSLGVQQATTSPLQQPNHAPQPHHEQHYPLPQMQPPSAYYDREMSDA